MSEAPAAPEKKKKSDEWFAYYRKRSILGLHLLGALIAFLAPLDVLSQSAAAKALVDAVSSVVPLPVNFTKHSAFPQLQQLYGAAMLISAPWWLWVWLRGPYQEKQVQRMRERAQGRVSVQLILIFFTLAAPFATYLYLYWVTPTDFHLVPFQSERWALAIFGPIFYCWAPVAPLVLAISSIVVLRRIWGGK